MKIVEGEAKEEKTESDGRSGNKVNQIKVA